MKQLKKLPNTYLYESIKNIDKLSGEVRRYLGVNPKQHNLYVLARLPTITLVVDSPIFATQLRYQLRDILRHVNTRFLSEYKNINVKLAPPITPPPPAEKARKELSQSVKDILASAREALDKE